MSRPSTVTLAFASTLLLVAICQSDATSLLRKCTLTQWTMRSVKLSWTPATTDETLTYKYQYNRSHSVELLSPVGNRHRNVIVAGLRADTRYEFTVTALKNNRPRGSVKCSGRTRKDAKPVLLRGECTLSEWRRTSVKLTWPEATPGGDYTFKYKYGSQQYTEVNSNRETVVTGLRADTSYEFTVTVFKDDEPRGSVKCSGRTVSDYCGSYAALNEHFSVEVLNRRDSLQKKHPINVSVAVEYFSGETDQYDFNAFCSDFKVAVPRIKNDDRCKPGSPPDNRPFVFFWNNGASDAFATMCNKQAEFKKPCLKNPGFSKLKACDVPRAAGRRRRREACGDFEKETKCARDVVRDRCGDDTAKVVCTMISSLLKATLNTKDCTGAVAMCSAVKSTNSVLSTLIPSIIVLLAARRQFFIN